MFSVNRTERTAFLGAFEEEIATARSRTEMFGLLIVQMSGLSRVNMTLGYDGGDLALAELAARLARVFGNRARIIRIGTGRFALLLRAVKGEEHAMLAARRVEQIANEPVSIAGHAVPLSVVQGVALYPAHGESGADLLRHAEAALTNAAEADDPVALYDGSATTRMRASLLVDAALLDALADNRVEAWFQPQLDVRSGRVIGAEALLRCRGPDGKPLPTDHVIEAAARLRRMDELTGTMLNAALRRAAEWQSPDGGLRVSVNVSAATLRESGLVDRIGDALRVWCVQPDVLTVEITESVFIHEPEQSFRTMRKLRELGVRVAIDDFGTGYSSLAYFRDIPANELKVDKSFVIGMLDDVANRRIVRAVIELAHSFDLEVVAEGVEDEPTLEELDALGCDIVQGYHIGRPMPADEFVIWFDRSSDTRGRQRRS